MRRLDGGVGGVGIAGLALAALALVACVQDAPIASEPGMGAEGDNTATVATDPVGEAGR